MHDEIAYLTSIRDEYQLRALLALLDANGIPALRMDRSSGEYMRIATGYSAFGADVFVPQEALLQAQELLVSSMVPVEPDSLEEQALSAEPSRPKRYWRWLAAVSLVTAGIVLLYALISMLIQLGGRLP